MSSALVSTLRAQPIVVRLPDLAPGAGTLAVRVQIPEVWDALRVEAPPTASVIEVKRLAMAHLLPGAPEAQDFVVKVRGHEVLDESVSLAAAGVRNGSTLLVTSRRRRPVH
jgi:hypothetical protein